MGAPRSGIAPIQYFRLDASWMLFVAQTNLGAKKERRIALLAV